MGKERDVLPGGFAWLFLDRMGHHIFFFFPICFSTISYLHIPPGVQVKNLHVVLDAAQDPWRRVSYSGSCCLGSFLLRLPSVHTAVLAPSLSEYRNCGCISLQASNLLSPPINRPSHGHSDFPKPKAGRTPPLLKTLHLEKA